jgi:hypothetical protein
MLSEAKFSEVMWKEVKGSDMKRSEGKSSEVMILDEMCIIIDSQLCSCMYVLCGTLCDYYYYFLPYVIF